MLHCYFHRVKVCKVFDCHSSCYNHGTKRTPQKQRNDCARLSYISSKLNHKKCSINLRSVLTEIITTPVDVRFHQDWARVWFSVQMSVCVQ